MLTQVNYAQAVDRLRPAGFGGGTVIKENDVCARLKLFVGDRLQQSQIDLLLNGSRVWLQVDKCYPFLVFQLIHEIGLRRSDQQSAAMKAGADNVPVAGRF